MKPCYLLNGAPANTNGGGTKNFGGNLLSAKSITVRRWAAIGDSLAASIVADKLSERGYEVNWLTHPSIHCVIRRQPRIGSVTEFGHADVDLDGAYEKDPHRRNRHFSEMFLEKSNQQLTRYGVHLGEPINCRPRIEVTPLEKLGAAARFAEYPRPWVFLCPRSDTYAARQVPDGIWQEAAGKIQGTKFWIGRHPAPAGMVDLKCQHLDNLIIWLSVADLLISVDTGPLHIAAALGTPVLALGQSSSPDLHLSDQCDFLTIWPHGLDCLNCQQNLCPINATVPPCQKFDPAWIAAWANAKLGQLNSGLVSAVIACWKPEVSTLNRCIEAVLPQVHEVIVSCEGKSILPPGAIRHARVRYVRTPKHSIGYSGNANYGARQSVGEYLLQINDDVFVDPGSVEKLKEAMKPGVGIVSGMLYYGDGKTIYHAGKVRRPGERGWGHIDLHSTQHTFKDVTEMENVNGAFTLTRREAFYAANAFDEELPIFANDDALCLSVRQAGYKILFTPHARGIHLEHQSVNKIGNIIDLVGSANRVFDRKWGWYLTLNKDRIPGQFT